ncbi:MAG: PQQ-binding-like beta-propeller repeat protein [Verrucomicrobiales bacterium]|nr:PQQ-binding-like beta-propeller repeat protein [Verrucomicrobiales bacterium]
MIACPCMKKPMLTFCVFALVLAAGLGLPVQSQAEDWPRFLGPRGDGISQETGLIDTLPLVGPPLLWSKAVGTGYSAPSVLDNRLVLHHRLENREIVESFDAVTGKSEWQYASPTSYVDPYGYNNGPRCTPLLTAELCFTLGAEGRLTCLERKTGKLVWERDTAKDWQVPPAFFGVGSTPILEGDRLLVMVGGQPNAGMVAFDAKTGKTLWESVGQKNWEGLTKIGWPGEPVIQWQTWEKQASYASPVAATIHGHRHVLCLTRQGLVSVNPTNGQVNFSFWFRSRANDSVNAMNPVVQGDLILISGAYYRVGSVLLRVRPDGRGVDEVWRGTALEIHWMTPILHDGSLYAFSGRNEPDARIRCVDMKSGKLKWDRDESWPPHSAEQPPVYGRGSFVMADGKLFALGEGGLLGIFRVNPDKLEELGRYQVPDLKYPCWAAPVLSNQRLYLRNEHRLVAYDVRKR